MLLLTATTLTGAAKAAAWICFGLGGVLLLGGAGIGLWLSVKEMTASDGKPAKAKAAEAKKKVESLSATATTAAAAAPGDATATAEVKEKAKEAESAVKEIEGLIAALPERLRYAGLMVLLGAALISVASVQFGGHSIF